MMCFDNLQDSKLCLSVFSPELLLFFGKYLCLSYFEPLTSEEQSQNVAVVLLRGSRDSVNE